MKPVIRRLSVAVAALATLLVIAAIGLRLHGQHRLEETLARFEREVGPLPEIPADMTTEIWQRKISADSQVRMEQFRVAREAADAALEELAAGDRQGAMTHFQETVRYRDEFLNEPWLLAQLVGLGAGRKSIEVTAAFLEFPDLQPGEIELLASSLETPSPEGWKGAMANEAVLSQIWSKEDFPEAGVLEGIAIRLQQPYTVAASLGMYLGMFEAARDRVDDVRTHIQETYKEAGKVPWMYPIAEILIPNLVDIAEKRRDYLNDLDALRSRLPKPHETSAAP